MTTVMPLWSFDIKPIAEMLQQHTHTRMPVSPQPYHLTSSLNSFGLLPTQHSATQGSLKSLAEAMGPFEAVAVCEAQPALNPAIQPPRGASARPSEKQSAESQRRGSRPKACNEPKGRKTEHGVSRGVVEALEGLR